MRLTLNPMLRPYEDIQNAFMTHDLGIDLWRTTQRISMDFYD